MIRRMGVGALLALAVFSQDAGAQNNSLGVSLMGGQPAPAENTTSQIEPRGKGYYRFGGRCWYLVPGGQYRRVFKYHCR